LSRQLPLNQRQFSKRTTTGHSQAHDAVAINLALTRIPGKRSQAAADARERHLVATTTAALLLLLSAVATLATALTAVAALATTTLVTATTRRAPGCATTAALLAVALLVCSVSKVQESAWG
jgi:uncharacterized protein YciW